MFMPSKNVYVAEADLPLFEQASHLAGGMSAAVAAGLRLYLAQHEKKQKGAGMETIELKVDEGGVVRTKRFSGRPLLRWEANDGLRTRTFRVYATARGQYAVYTRDDPDWSKMSAEDDDSPLWKNQETWNNEWWRVKHRELRVFPDTASMRGDLPDGLVDGTERASSQPAVEELDI
jgi:hypothetical protein